MKTFSPSPGVTMVPFISLIWIAAVGIHSAQAQLPPGGLPAATVTVLDASGSPVEGAIACIGTVTGLMEYGQAATNAFGVAFFYSLLPEGPATIYFTAGKDGYSGQSAQQYVVPTPPPVVEGQIQLSSSPGGTVCPADAGWPSGPQLDIFSDLLQELDAPTEVDSRELFEVKLILKRPAPVSMVVVLESSNPRVLAIPRQVTIPPGERTATVHAEVTGEVRRLQAVTLTGRLEIDSRQVVRKQIAVRRSDSRTKEGDRE